MEGNNLVDKDITVDNTSELGYHRKQGLIGHDPTKNLKTRALHTE